MKTLFACSIICALCSVVAAVALSLIEVDPTPNNLQVISRIFGGMLASALFWSAIAVWIGIKLPNTDDSVPVSLWLRAPLILISALYVLALLFGFFI
jgi:hypothetical protein